LHNNIVTRLWAGRPGFNSWQGKGFFFSLCRRDHTSSGAHSDSYPLGTEGFYTGCKMVGTWNLPLTSI